MIIATAAHVALPPPGCSFGSPEVSRLRRGPGSGGARLARQGGPVPPPPPSPSCNTSASGWREPSRPGGSPARRAGDTAAAGCCFPAVPGRLERRRGRTLLCRCRRVRTRGHAHTKAAGPFAPQMQRGEGKCGKSTHCVLFLILHLPSSGLEGFREVVACVGLNVTRLRGNLFIYLLFSPER